jgi:UDP:flavonoid glycosyltransferase YjiC (YdhE family)
MRVLVSALAPSHLMPMVPLTWALRNAGHDVLLVGQSDVVATARQAGIMTVQVGPEQATAHQWKLPPATQARRSPFALPGSSRTTPWVDDEPPWEEMGRRWEARLMTFIEDYLDVARAWRPDLILADPLEFAGPVAAGVLRVPVVLHRWGLDNFSTALWEPARRALDGLCERLGAPAGLPDPALVIDPCPPSVQSPNVPQARPMAFRPYNGTGSLPDWALTPPKGTRVCICFGAWNTATLAEDGRLRTVVEVVAQAVEAVGDLEPVLLLPKEARAELGPLPAGVHVTDPLPLNAFMADSGLVVHHGGNGTALTALAYGVPQLIVAQEGPLLVPNAELIHTRGAGRAVISEEDRGDVELLKSALLDVIEQPSYRSAAAEVRAEMDAMPSPEAVAALFGGV